jgi:hypothetical protein
MSSSHDSMNMISLEDKDDHSLNEWKKKESASQLFLSKDENLPS